MKLIQFIPWLLVVTMGFLGLLRLENVVHQLNAEKSRAIYAECLVLKEAVKPLHDIIIFATNPVNPIAQPDPDKRAVTDIARADARKAILPLIPNVECKKNG